MARQLHRRQATVSDIENGKNDIGVLTLLQFALVLETPITALFPESLLQITALNIPTEFDRKLRDVMHTIEELGDRELVLRILHALGSYYLDQTEFQPTDHAQTEDQDE